MTSDPKDSSSVAAELSAGSHSYSRYFVRFDTGEFAKGTSAYFSVSNNDYDVWIGEGAGGQKRQHIDFKLVKEFDNGATVKVRNSYNDRDGVGYNIVSYLPTPCIAEPNRCFFDPFVRANPAFPQNTETDGYTDAWTGDPMVDRLNRRTRGNQRKDNLLYAEVDLPIGDSLDFSFKPYLHDQEGIGRFANHRAEGAVPDPIANDSDPILYIRNNNYEMDRFGAVLELDGYTNDWLEWTVGIWFEKYNRTQTRNWHQLVDFTAGPEFVSTPYHTSEDKEWDNQVSMFYLSNRSSLLDDDLILEYGLTFLDNEVDYQAPIQDSDDDLLNITSSFSGDSGWAPKFSALYKMKVFAGFARNIASVTDGVMEDIGDEAASGDNIKIGVELDEADVFDVGLRYFTENTEFAIQAFSLTSTEFTPIDLSNSLALTTVAQGRKVKGIIANSCYIYTMLGDLELLRLISELSHNANRKLIVDIEPTTFSSKQELEQILVLADIAIFKADYYKAFDANVSRYNLEQMILKYCLEGICVTLGQDGSVALIRGEYAYRSAFNIPVIDTTGAGDTFNATLLRGIVNNYDINKTLRYTTASAAISIGAIGAKGCIPSHQDIDLFLANNKIS